MTSWKSTPMLKVFNPFILGFLIAFNFQNIHINILWIGSLFVVIFGLRLLKYSNQTIIIKSFSLYILFFLLGILTIQNHNSNKNRSTFLDYLHPKNVILGKVISMPVVKEDKTIFLLETQYISDSSSNFKTHGKLQIQLYESQNPSRIQYGDILILKGKIKPFVKPKNPSSFDYQKFMETKGVLASAAISEHDWQIYQKAKPSILHIANQLRQKFKLILEQYLPVGNERSVGLALILGYKSELSTETKSQYAVTGSMHILAVSGLHVGLIFILLHFLLKKIVSKSRWIIFLKIMVHLLGVWGFVLITGASISVIRAGIMFSFIILGKSLSLKTNTYNSILVSIIFILILDPMQIKTVGFQLSYLAVISIIWLHPKIKKLINFQNIFLKYLWELTTISIAAQILVLPLGIFYFHQFPIYFWLSSWFVIPLATIILYLGIFLFGAYYIFMPLASFLGFLLYGSIWMLNSSVFLIEQLPFNHIGHIWLERWELLTLYIIIIWIAKSILRKKIWGINWGLGLICLLVTIHIFHTIQYSNKDLITFYYVPNHTVMDFKIGNDAHCITNASLEIENYAALGNRMKNKYDILHRESIDSILETKYYLHYKNFIFTANDSFYIQNSSGEIPKNIHQIIVTKNSTINLDDFQNLSEMTLLIHDASNHPNQNLAWESLSEINHLMSYNVTRLGAYHPEKYK